MTTSSQEFLSILIVSFNGRDHLRRCLASIKNHCPTVPHEIIVIDNASPDGSADMVADEFPWCKLIRLSENVGYGSAINLGVRTTKGNFLMFLNPDIEVGERTVDALLEFAAAHPRAGVIGPRLLLSDGQPQSSARRFLSAALLLFEASRLHLLLPAGLRGRALLCTYSKQEGIMRVPWISGACHLIPRAVWEQVGPLTEETFCGFDDYDYCYRVTEEDYEVWFYGSATMTHYCSVSVNKRWKSWEVEQVAIHNTYVVLASHWPKWRIKVFALAEVTTWLIEAVRHMLMPRSRRESLEEGYGRRLQRRLGLTLRLLVGFEEPRRRFEPAGRS